MSRTSPTNHPTSNELHEFLSGRLPSRRAEELETHINFCPPCSNSLEKHSELHEGESLLDWDDKAQFRTDSFVDHQNVLDDELGSIPISCDSPQIGTGMEFNGYCLNSLIGEGGNGIVYRATQRQPVRRTVAIKFAKPSATGFSCPHRFLLERQMLAGLKHPSIPHVYDAGLTENGLAYFVMEYIEGQQLTEVLRGHQLPLSDCFELMKLLCDVVQYAHRNGVIHRDLKPSNILIERDHETGEIDIRRPWVIDFGIAKNLDRDAPTMTGANEMLGTLEYMSPEQLGVKPRCDTRSDVYALGLIFYELLAFRLPFSRILRFPTPSGPSQSMKY